MTQDKILEAARKLPPPHSGPVSVSLVLLEAYYKLHDIKPYKYIYYEKVFDDVMIVRKKQAGD